MRCEQGPGKPHPRSEVCGPVYTPMNKESNQEGLNRVAFLFCTLFAPIHTATDSGPCDSQPATDGIPMVVSGVLKNSQPPVFISLVRSVLSGL